MSTQPVHKKKLDPTKFHRDMTNINILVTVLTVLANITVVYTMMNTTRFSSLSKMSFIAVNVIAMLLLVVLNVLVLLGIRSKKKSIYITGIVMMCIFVLIGGYGTWVIASVNKSVNKITATTVKESVDVSLVVYDEEGTSDLKSITDLNGRTVGYATGTNPATLGKKKIDSEGINVSYQEYQDYSSLALGLFSGEIQCALLPSNYQSMFQNETGLADYLDKTSSILDFSDDVIIENKTGSDVNITQEPFTVLLLGTADGMSDTMILCSVNPISMKVTMTSIPRDSYVPITCYGGGSSKLNASRAVSIDCTIATIEQLTGISIDYYVDTNFQGVVDIVDALGGIVVNSPVEFVGQNSSSERGHYTVYVPAGDNVLLHGEQALAFARERHLFATGDFARQQHQQEVIEAIVRSILRTRDINTFVKVLEAAGDNISTNLSVDQMTSFVSYAMKKIGRFYDEDHPEDVFLIQSSRITGYNSGLWDENLQIVLSIVRLWNGSISAEAANITRNIDMNSTITPMEKVQWSANWEFEAPIVSYDVYDEARVESEVPPTVPNFIGRDIGVVTSWATANNIQVGINYVQDSTQANGVVTSQDVAEGTQISDITYMTVTVVDNSVQPTATPAATPTATPIATPQNIATPESTTTPAPSQTVEPTTQPSVPTAEPSAPTAEPIVPTAEPSTPTAEPSTPTEEPSTPTQEPSTPTQEPSTPTQEPTAVPAGDNESSGGNGETGDPT